MRYRASLERDRKTPKFVGPLKQVDPSAPVPEPLSGKPGAVNSNVENSKNASLK
jgi:hypothetical protein